MTIPRRGLLALVTDQLLLELERPVTTGEEFLARLSVLGLSGIDRCVLTRNRSVMISFRRGVLRVNRAYLSASPDVHRAIVAFVMARTRHIRRVAERIILEHPIAVEDVRGRRERSRVTRPADVPLIEKLTAAHQHYNTMLFGGTLSAIAIHISGRMRNRLGQYAAPCTSSGAAEITISRRHIRRHGWQEVLHTLLHEMVHQWQAETGLPIDHGRAFRRKAREVGIEPFARRRVTAEGRGKREESVG
jgi:hypothetical protein